MESLKLLMPEKYPQFTTPGVVRFQLTKKRTPLREPEPYPHALDLLPLSAESILKDTPDQPVITAHWLPWVPLKIVTNEKGEIQKVDATVITLNPKEAKHFFTAQLAGCRVVIDKRNPQALVIAHIGGHKAGTNEATTPQEMDEAARALLGDGYEGCIWISGLSTEGKENEGLNVFGFFNDTTERWEIWAQQVDFNDEKGPCVKEDGCTRYI